MHCYGRAVSTTAVMREELPVLLRHMKGSPRALLYHVSYIRKRYLLKTTILRRHINVDNYNLFRVKTVSL